MQELLILREELCFNGVRVARSLRLWVVLVIIVCPFVLFSFGYYVVCPSICGFSPPYRFGIFKLFLCIKQSLHRYLIFRDIKWWWLPWCLYSPLICPLEIISPWTIMLTQRLDYNTYNTFGLPVGISKLVKLWHRANNFGQLGVKEYWVDMHCLLEISIYIYIYIYVWKLNQTVLELDFRAVKFLFFPRRDLNPHHCYTAAPFA
jgi:hypothetical protein